MITAKDGGAAFPIHDSTMGWHQRGMTMRVYIATQLMAATVNSSATFNKDGGTVVTKEEYACLAVSYADALIAELSK